MSPSIEELLSSKFVHTLHSETLTVEQISGIRVTSCLPYEMARDLCKLLREVNEQVKGCCDCLKFCPELQKKLDQMLEIEL